MQRTCTGSVTGGSPNRASSPPATSSGNVITLDDSVDDAKPEHIPLLHSLQYSISKRRRDRVHIHL